VPGVVIDMPFNLVVTSWCSRRCARMDRHIVCCTSMRMFDPHSRSIILWIEQVEHHPPAKEVLIAITLKSRCALFTHRHAFFGRDTSSGLCQFRIMGTDGMVADG